MSNAKQVCDMSLPELIDELGDTQDELNELHERARALKNLIELEAAPGSGVVRGERFIARFPELRCAPLRV